MKKICLLGLLAAFVLINFSSCTKCAECYKWNTPTEKICRDDFPSKDSYNDAFRGLQVAGYECQYVAR